jgi:ParB-like chromosome segregation protein Spo0J
MEGFAMMTLEQAQEELRAWGPKVEEAIETVTSLGSRSAIRSAKGEIKLPCMVPFIVPIEKVQANDYNPNEVPKSEMELLEQSIRQNGFAFCVDVIWDPDQEVFVIVDGFHRYAIFRDYLQAKEIPVVINARSNPVDRMSATVQFNRARGVHTVDGMGTLVTKLIQQGAEDDEIARRLGMSLEEVLRLKQTTGIASLFSRIDYSDAWEMEEVE